ncbi:phage tail family protein [Saccharopolyspora sp. K220]|uniref:phage distal tail protein n=1 Tax=Saccharopolyspora soli TaxID=2926618 RepID=UPI001F5AA66C|nr:phage tail domain-containing protein [Saccharopolyspora soli]MCI2421513.1 phage tail family protein [Saccharopolyspora soli]
MAAGDLITTDGQIEWRGALLGVDTAYGLVQLEGWQDLPDMRDGDAELDNQHGYQPGKLLADRRIVTLSFELGERSEADFRAAELELRRITAPDENPAEEPLVVQWQGIKAMVMARCTGRLIPTPVEYFYGLTRGTIQWRATNPRLLHLPQQSSTTSPPAAGGGGLMWPLQWPLAWGAAQSGGEIVLTNTGNAHAQPVWRITGSCTRPVVRNADTGDQLAFDDTFTLPAGQTVVLTTQDKSVLLTTGVSRSNRLARRQWFTLPPGPTRIRFETSDGGGQLECHYHHTSF